MLAISSLLLWSKATHAAAESAARIELQVRPRVCTLSLDDEACDARVEARWRSPQHESLCLLIVGRPEIKRCWDHFSAGEYVVSLSFSEDLLIELRDADLQTVLASQAIKVIREAQQLRRKRRQPWSILF